MAHFYGKVTGRSKTAATRLGTKKSGLTTECNGWQAGIRAVAETTINSDGVTEDIFYAYPTVGSAVGRHPFGNNTCIYVRVFANGDRKLEMYARGKLVYYELLMKEEE